MGLLVPPVAFVVGFLVAPRAVKVLTMNRTSDGVALFLLVSRTRVSCGKIRPGANERTSNLQKASGGEMTCLEAIETVLQKTGKPLRAKEIAERINGARMYVRRDGSALPAYQVYSMAHSYSDRFTIRDGLISLLGIPPATPEPQETEVVRGTRITAGIAGEHFVAAELSKQGWVIGLTAKNSAAVDLFAKYDRYSKSLSLQVKTRTPAYRYAWRLSRAGLPLAADFCVFVDLGDESESPEYWVVPASQLTNLCKSDQIRTGDLATFKDRWDLLYQAVGAGGAADA